MDEGQIEYTGHLQPIPDGSKEFRLYVAGRDRYLVDPYPWSCVIRRHADGSHEMSLVDKPLPSARAWHAIVRTLYADGIKLLKVHRHGNERTIDIEKFANHLSRNNDETDTREPGSNGRSAV
ncbi:hypothetical protein [uncultured Maricaulis sp.]|uniref:hypothetical protein n=1 Tax=uncultured Maricaulis sp. TaxID=174710 RepID=UPI0030DC3F8C|tara:strand:+ start:4968 stop:5333 length:366 start_codon:yes stop_codon:yes gene_type:complete